MRIRGIYPGGRSGGGCGRNGQHTPLLSLKAQLLSYAKAGQDFPSPNTHHQGIANDPDPQPDSTGEYPKSK